MKLKVPDIRALLPEDFDEVVALLESEGFKAPRDIGDLHGVALVARDLDEDSGEIVGFIWALAALGIPVAYVDYFAVRADLQKTSIGFFLAMTLGTYLRNVGVSRTLWVTPPSNRGFIRMMMKRGGEDLGIRQVIATDLVETRSDSEDEDGRLLHVHNSGTG